MIAAVEYEKYMASAYWANRKRHYFKNHAKKCRACGSNREIHLHHLSYLHMGKEPSGDLMPLCRTCHMYVHEFALEHDLPLRQATYKVVDKVRYSLRRVSGKTTRPTPWPRQEKPDFIPLRQRLTLEERKKEATTGREGRLGGLPIRTVAAGGGSQPH